MFYVHVVKVQIILIKVGNEEKGSCFGFSILFCFGWMDDLAFLSASSCIKILDKWLVVWPFSTVFQ